MDTRRRDNQLELTILSALQRSRPQAFRDVMIRATPDGVVWLRGLVSTQADCLLLKQIVGHVPGVTQVFCNVAPKARQRKEVCHA